MTIIATEDFSVANDPLSDSADWTQAGAGIAGAGLAAGGAFLAGTTAGPGGGSYWASDVFADNQYAEAVINGSPNGDTNWAILLRCADADPDECLIALFLGGSDEVQCWYVDSAGSPTQIGVTTAMTGLPALGDTLRAEVDGNNLTILFDFGAGMVEQETFDISASGITGGSPGVMIQDPSGAGNFTDWEGGNLAAGGPTGTGEPAAQDAAVAGSGIRGAVGEGTPAADDSAAAGAGVRGLSGSGAPAAEASTVVGVGSDSGDVSIALTVAANQELKNAFGTPQANLVDIVWEWYDTPGSTAGEPIDSGLITTNVSGEATVNVVGSNLANGEFGQLILYHPGDPDIRATLRVPVVK